MENNTAIISTFSAKVKAKTTTAFLEKLIPVNAPKTLQDMEYAILDGMGVGDLAGMRLCKQVERVCKEKMYAGMYTSFEKWATAFKPLNVKNRQGAYNYVNRAKLIADDCMTSIFEGRDGEKLIFTLTQLDAIYNAVKESDDFGAFTITESGIKLVQSLIINGVALGHFPDAQAKALKTSKNFGAFSAEKTIDGDLKETFVYLSPYMPTRLMVAFLKYALMSADEIAKAKEDKEAKKAAKEGDDGDDSAENAGWHFSKNDLLLIVKALTIAPFDGDENATALTLASNIRKTMQDVGMLGKEE